MIYISAFGIFLLIIIAFLVSNSITRPIKFICNATDRLSKGDFDITLPKIERNDEIGRLIENFDHMRTRLKDYIQQIALTTAKNEKIMSELSIAREIQHGILPKIFPPYPEYNGLDIFALLDSAKEVGGDLYDFALFDDNKLYICIGDVSGKGVPASLFMAVGKTLLKSTMLSLKDPAKALFYANNELSENNDSCMFITVFCGIIDLNTNMLIYANAGHNPPLIIKERSAEFLELISSPPLGAMTDINFENQTIRLSIDESLLLYTDGVTEAMTSNKELFSADRLLDTVCRFKPKTSEECIKNIKNKLISFVDGAEQSDDITMLCLSNNTKKVLIFDETIKFKANMAEYKNFLTWLGAVSKRLSWEQNFFSQINLVLEEWIINIISHAFEDKNTHWIEVRLWQDNKHLNISVIDDGIPFNPVEYSIDNTSASLEDRKIGGLGISFIKQTLDSFDYERQGNKNIVTMKKSRKVNHE
jgi:sigma-B regulation protein RsbU (phosphoserine phosphatase)